MSVSSRIYKLLLLPIGLAIPLASPGFAQEASLKRPKVFDDVVECRAVTDDSARLACYDEKVAKLETAQQDETLFVADKADVQEAKRGLFGLSLPRIRLFTGSDGDDINEINSTVKSVRRVQYGNYQLELEDGARWQQTDGKNLGRGPKAGQTVIIKRAALGSFTAQVNGKRSFKVKRVN